MKRDVCDRCEDVLIENGDRIRITVETDFFDTQKTMLGDLCKSCYESFIDWVWDDPPDAAELKEEIPEKPEEVDQPDEIEKKEPEDAPQAEVGHGDMPIPAKKVKKGGTFVRWTKNDIDKLKIGYKHQKTIAELAKELRRTESALTQRIIILKNSGEL